jgi:hypothetical protein
MKRPLNLNGPAAKILGAVALLTAGLPILLYASSSLLELFHLRFRVISALIRLSLSLGLLLLAAFLLLIVIEQIQDHWYDVSYRRHRGEKIKGPGIYHECQYCGNRQVRESDRYCRICGRKLV